MENEYNEKMRNSLEQQIFRTQTKEGSLMDELKKQDEDLDSLRKTNKELEKKLEFVRKQKDNLEVENQKRAEAFEKKRS